MNKIPLVTMTDHIQIGDPWLQIKDEVIYPPPAKQPEPYPARELIEGMGYEILAISNMVRANNRLLIEIREHISTPWYTRLMNWARSFFR
jgi:hypothetical protein